MMRMKLMRTVDLRLDYYFDFDVALVAVAGGGWNTLCGGGCG